MTKREAELLICSICGAPIEVEPVTGWAYGHNAEPVNDGRCCTECNTQVVLPTRIRRIMRFSPKQRKPWPDS